MVPSPAGLQSERMSTALHLPVSLGRALLDALLPPQCLTCDHPVSEQGQICASCFKDIAFLTHPFCPRCALPASHAQALGAGLCDQCQINPPPWHASRAALRYDTASRRLILPLKYADRTDLARPLARLMARAGAEILAEADLLIPVPLHPQRLRMRGYNQAALLARALELLSGVPACLDALVRLRATESLAEMSASLREATVAGAFALRKGRTIRIAEKRIVLIDDVLTSGATATACTQALLAAGAARVSLLVAARVPDPRAA